MNRLKEQRRNKRIQSTRMVNHVQAVLDAGDGDLVEMQANIEYLQEVHETLDELDQKIADKMLDEDTPEADRDREAEETGEYKLKFLRVRKRVQKLENESASSSPPSVSTAASDDDTTGQRNFKLPKVELRKFNGELKQWLSWWSQFKIIHEDKKLHTTDKFQYLSQSMEPGTEAKELVDSFPQTDDNYSMAIEALTNRFGRSDLLLQVYIRELLTLVISNVTSKTKAPLSSLYLKLESHLRSLSALNLNQADPATWLFPLVESSLSEDTLRAWQRSSLSKQDGTALNPPKTRLDYLMDFIKVEVQSDQQISLAQAGFQSCSVTGDKKKTATRQRANQSQEEIATAAGLLSTQSTKRDNCVFCGKKHESDRCVKAHSMSLQERKKKVEDAQICLQCLKGHHSERKCKTFVKCLLCGDKHYPIMCPMTNTVKTTGDKRESISRRRDESPESFQRSPYNRTESPEKSASNSNHCSGDVILNTLRIRLLGESGAIIVRLVGDTGSQRSYVMSSTVSRAGCKIVGEEWLQNVLFGGSITKPQCNKKFRVLLQTLDGSRQRSFDLLEQQQICGKLPQIPQGPWIKELEHNGIHLSDQGPGNLNIDILLGNDYWGSLLTGRIHHLSCGLVAVETVFGWTCGGRIPTSNSNLAVQMTSSMLNASMDVSQLWSLELLGIHDPIETKSATEEEKEAADHFSKTVARDENGTYIVELPFKRDPVDLPDNRAVAEKRLKRASWKLKNENLWSKYDEVFRAWEEEGFIVPVEDEVTTGHFLPHRPVLKLSSTTPVRPVFDASCKSKNGLSLNAYLHKGPNLLEKVPSLLLRFREQEIGVTADIRKAFQMLRVQEDHQRFQRFLWWKDETCSTVKIYQHQRVVFGLSSSPFLLGACINHHLNNWTENTQIAEKLKMSFYVDNCVTSVASMQEYESFKTAATQVMREAGMDLRQWACTLGGGFEIGLSKPEGCGLSLTESTVSVAEPPSISVLGMLWDQNEDSLHCDVKTTEQDGTITKRKILSVLSQIFDPIGILSPALLAPKSMLQHSWMQGVTWDEEVPEKTKKEFVEWIVGSSVLGKIRIPRHFQLSGSTSRSIHVFCDASQTAYAAVIFMRSENKANVNVQLLLAKSRVAPISKKGVKVTIPRLELLACVIGSRLAGTIRESIGCENIPFYYWSDSSTALAWIKRKGDWARFVDNRVTQILSCSECQEWRHVPGHMNPADLPSRGCSPHQLLRSKWWEGPHWLYGHEACWPDFEANAEESEVAAEVRKSKVTTFTTTTTVFSNYSSYRKAITTWGWVLRFLKACRRKSASLDKFLSIEELRTAEKIVLRKIQEEAFPVNTTEIGGILVEKSDGLYKVRTKLVNRPDKRDFVLPIVLPHNHPLVELLIMDVHKFYGHAGIQFCMGKLREKYWILRSRRTIRKIVGKCVICKRFTSKPVEVDPSALPLERVETSLPFQTTGVDLAGPLFLKDGSKVWMVLFTCAVYRGVYIDLVSSISTEAFLGALERFIGLFGRPNTIFSDNGTNFVGTDNLLRSLNWKEVERVSDTKQIRFRRSPPTASWWGGWWERLIRTIKDLLKRMLGKSKLTYDQLRTCLAGVSAVINDRPLTVVSEDGRDLIPLSPNTFLRQQTGHFPETEEAEGLSKSYQTMKILQTQIQERFRREYLGQLVMRHNEKRRRNVDPLRVGDIVLVGTDNRKRYEWPLGKVLELYPGKDGKERVAKVKTAGGVLIRPIQRLYQLEIPHSKLRISPEVIKEKIEEENSQDKITTRSGRSVKKPNRYGQWFNNVNYN